MEHKKNQTQNPIKNKPKKLSTKPKKNTTQNSKNHKTEVIGKDFTEFPTITK